tara:strand:+ start:1463 stop:2230 length:768 start_codon:yes stop_codon:yes gene_type:complete
VDKPAFYIDNALSCDVAYLSDVGHPILLYVEGALPRGKKHPIHTIQKRNIKKFNKVSIFQAEDKAVEFAISECERQGLYLGERLARNFIKIVGVDYGIITHELFKARMLLNGGKEILPTHFRAVAQVTEVSAQTIIVSVQTKKVRPLLKALSSVRSTHSNDPSLMVCGWLGSEARKWLLCASLSEQGKPLSKETTGIHPFVLKKSLIPNLKNWDVPLCLRLVHLISQTERYVKTGGKNAWTRFESDLTMLIQRQP